MRDVLSSYWWVILVLIVALVFLMGNIRRGKRQ
jgi:hypothetical protein